MLVRKLRVINFKKFKDNEFEFNEDINIIVGDNESGKSTILEAIELCLNLNYRGRPLATTLSTDLFNSECVQEFLGGDKGQASLPEILIEAYLDGEGVLKGNNNQLSEDTSGLFVRVFFDPELSPAYAEFVKDQNAVTTLPIEFYKFEWFSFAWNHVNRHSKQIGCLFVDPPRLHPTYGTQKYISDILGAAFDLHERSILNLNFRQLKKEFGDKPDVSKINNDLDKDNEISEKNIGISLNTSSQTSWENNLQLNLEEIPFTEIGKGEQHQIQIKLALWRKAKDADVVMLEEPENHLSHINLVKLIKFIEEQSGGQQVFLTTHSSYVLNKLSFEKICLISTGYKRLHEIDEGTIKTLKRLPGYDTLRAILSQKIILVEGPSDELLIKKIYRNQHDGRLPEEDGIDVIVVRGIGFKNYLNIVRHIGNITHVVKDNDGNHQENIIDWKAPYDDCDFIEVFSPTNNEERSLEPSLIITNCGDLAQLNTLAGVILTVQTKNNYDELDDNNLEERKEYLIDWFAPKSAGSKKVDSAMRIFDSDVDIEFPDYLKEAITFAE